MMILPKRLPHSRLHRLLIRMIAKVHKYPQSPAPCPFCATKAVRGWIERDEFCIERSEFEDERFFVEYQAPFCWFCGPKKEFFLWRTQEINVMRYWSYNAGNQR